MSAFEYQEFALPAHVEQRVVFRFRARSLQPAFVQSVEWYIDDLEVTWDGFQPGESDAGDACEDPGGA